MNFKYLCQQYDLGRLRRAAELSSGTVARVWKLETDGGLFLVRTLRDEAQGRREWEIFRHLRANGFTATPAIVVPCFEQEGQWGQVQEFCDGTRPDPAAPGVAAAMARTLRELARCMPEGLIHGDLGPWNMVRREDGSLFVIDFGSAREGDPYFDYASAFGGIINHTSPEFRPRICREFLEELQADRSHLLTQLALWAEEGIDRWTGTNEKMVSRFYHARNWAEENLRGL